MLLDHSCLDGSLLTFLIQLCIKKKKKCFQTLQNYNSLRDDSHITQYLKLFHSRNTCRTFSPTYCRKWQPLIYLQLISFIHFLYSYCFWIISHIQTYLDLFSKFLFFTRLFSSLCIFKPILCIFHTFSTFFLLLSYCHSENISLLSEYSFYIIFTV